MLAVLLHEPGEETVFAASGEAAIGAVNLAEVGGAMRRKGVGEPVIRGALAFLAIPVTAADGEVAWDAGLLRATTDAAGLSLGDRFCLALARRLSASVLTADRTWLRIAAATDVDIRLIR